ncbi:MAG: S-layer homology domain-containing protein [Acidimicrobiales bacterium]
MQPVLQRCLHPDQPPVRHQRRQQQLLTPGGATHPKPARPRFPVGSRLTLPLQLDYEPRRASSGSNGDAIHETTRSNHHGSRDPGCGDHAGHRTGRGYGGFSDVAATSYYSKAVAWMTQKGITTGTSPGCFSPNAPATRAQAAAFLYRMAGEPGGSWPSPFVDVTDAWAKKPVGWLYANGVTSGVDARHFAPDRGVTRGEFATLLYRYAGASHSGGHPFVDVTWGYQNQPIAWMAAKGITTGTDARHFAPNRVITRAEIATMLWRFKGSPSVSPKADATCATAPRAYKAGFKTPANLGVSVGPGVVAAYPSSSMGSKTITANGTVLQNKVVNGCLTIRGDNVTIRNVVVNCSGNYPIKVDGANGTRIEYSTLDCLNNNTKGILFQDATNFAVDRIHITRCDDQFFIDGGLGNSSIRNSVFHNQGPAGAAHTDGMQVGTFRTTTGSLTVTQNWWEYNRSGCCANAVLFNSGQAALTVVLRDNLIDADFGVHLIRCHASSRCIVDRNTISGTIDGYLVHDTSSATGIATCNRYVSGALVPNRYFDGIPVVNSGC